MKDKKEPAKPKDELSQRLQDSLRRTRPRTFPLLLAALGLAIGALALLIWWLAPKEPSPRLGVVAFDQVGVAGQEVALHGRLEQTPGEKRTVSLDGLELIFEDGKLILDQGEKPKTRSASTGSDGIASCAWTFPAEATLAEFTVRRVGTREAPGSSDRGRVFRWHADGKLALVQIEQALTKAPDQTWDKENIAGISPVEGAAETLIALEAAGYHIVYLALGSDQPLHYQRVRGWVKTRVREGPIRIPAGPVLARSALGGDAGKPWQRTAAALQAQFAGAHVAIAGTLDAAQQLHAAGCTVYYLGQGDVLPREVRRIKDWGELRKAIEK